MLIWDNKGLIPFVSVINNHSTTVGLSAYHKKDYIQRAEFVNMRAKKHRLCSPLVDDNADKELQAKRAKIEEIDKSNSMKAALERLKRDKMKKNLSLSKHIRVKPEARAYLQSIICKSEDKEVRIKTKRKFPGEKSFICGKQPNIVAHAT